MRTSRPSKRFSPPSRNRPNLTGRRELTTKTRRTRREEQRREKRGRNDSALPVFFVSFVSLWLTSPMPYTPVLATLGYVFSPDGRRVLMIHRNARPGDPHLGKYNGLGGKLDAGEDVVAGLRRELREEAGIEGESLRLAGTISWPGVGKEGEDWVGIRVQGERISAPA